MKVKICEAVISKNKNNSTKNDWYKTAVYRTIKTAYKCNHFI